MKRIIKRLRNAKIKIGFLSGAFFAIAGIILAFISTSAAIASLALSLFCAIMAAAFATARAHRFNSASARRLRVLTAELEGGSRLGHPNFKAGDEAIVRELHLRTLEEMRMMHAQLIAHLEKSEGTR